MTKVAHSCYKPVCVLFTRCISEFSQNSIKRYMFFLYYFSIDRIFSRTNVEVFLCCVRGKSSMKKIQKTKNGKFEGYGPNGRRCNVSKRVDSLVVKSFVSIRDYLLCSTSQ